MLSVVVPTYNEAGSLPILIPRLSTALRQAGLDFEIVIVDDNSPDGTGQLAEELAHSYPLQVVHRPGKNGLASAVVEGVQMARGDLIGVMDADLSHPPEVLPEVALALVEMEAGLAVGSRYVPGGGVRDWPMKRRLVSLFANILTRRLTPVKDATSGFFVIPRQTMQAVELNPIGFKIGLEVMARAPYETFVEVPYVFTDRLHGQSKFGSREVLAFLKQLALLYGEQAKLPRPRPRPRRLQPEGRRYTRL